MAVISSQECRCCSSCPGWWLNTGMKTTCEFPQFSGILLWLWPRSLRVLIRNCWQGQFGNYFTKTPLPGRSVSRRLFEIHFTAAEKKPCGRADSHGAVCASSAENAKLRQVSQNNRLSHLWKAVRHFWLFFINCCLLSSLFRCWEFTTSMNIWWIIRSLILLAVVVILFSSLPRCCSAVPWTMSRLTTAAESSPNP